MDSIEAMFWVVKIHRKNFLKRWICASLESKLSFCLVSRLKDLSGYDFDIPVNIEKIKIAKCGKTKEVLSGKTFFNTFN